MDFIEFLFLSGINLGMMVFIIRKWGIASAEGFCMAYLGAAALTDSLELIYHYFLSPDMLHLGYAEFAFRIYPTALHIVGLVVLFAGLAAVNFGPSPIARPLDKTGITHLKRLGVAIAIVGALLTSGAIYLVRALSAPSFYAAINAFRSQALPFGGFWYRGADVIVIGLGLTLPSYRNNLRRFFCTLAFMMLVSFFLRTNKGGLEEPVLWGALIVYLYDREFFRTLCRPRNVALACAIAFFGMGAKLWFLPFAYHRTENAPVTLTKIVDLATSTAATRWGDDSLYRGYCQFVNSLPDNRSLFAGNKVGIYTLTSWVPRFLLPNKPDHPFRGLGFMVYSDFHTLPMETPAPTLAGSAMADDGFRSLISYLFLAGIFLSTLRICTTMPEQSLYRHVGYVLFVLFGGLSAEEGILGLIYTLLLAYGVIAAAFFIESIWKLSRANSRPTAAVHSIPMRSGSH
ncbi:MAG TPA: hypothetical protein VJN21_04135 [Candidatus Acidoferrales bacterium]|nr:hypothetical protein [Candidatus Acidoferrales bacterium]